VPDEQCRPATLTQADLQFLISGVAHHEGDLHSLNVIPDRAASICDDFDPRVESNQGEAMLVIA
jgi:hypothetical protein